MRPHPGADEWQEQLREAHVRGDHEAVWDEPGPIGNTKAEWRRREH